MPTEHSEIFQALARPFPKECERTRSQGGVTLTYITARSVMNRFDEVVGPENWWPHYEETKDGIKCTVTIRMPDGREVAKEDGGGFATAMKAEDDVEKSGYSDALKRAGVAWGVGRYLYRDGVPSYKAAPAPKPVVASPPAPAPAPSWPSYKEWLDDYCRSVNEKSGTMLVTTFQLNRHLLKAIGTPGSKSEADNLKSGERHWRDNHEAMVTEARVYCKKLWLDRVAEAKAKLAPAGTPGSDDNMPTTDEDAVLDALAAKA